MLKMERLSRGFLIRMFFPEGSIDTFYDIQPQLMQAIVNNWDVYRAARAKLNVEQSEQTKGSEVYTFGHPQGTHDDRFWAICLAVLGTLEAEPGPRPDVFIFG